MTKKKSSGKSGKRRDVSGLLPPDPRVMEKMMADLHRVLEEQDFESMEEANAFLQKMVESGEPVPSSKPETPLGEAQDIIYQAWEARSRSQRVKLAKQALAISTDCADAYVLLAQESARNPEEALDFYRQGVEAGERAIGDEFDDMVEHFWGVLETRPYMRAREGLAETLWALGERKQAITHVQEMLRLNPHDNQGMRYILINWLLETGQDKEVDKLLKRYPDDYSASWHYSQALHSFRQSGASKQANEQLDAAISYNPHVPKYLLMRRPLPAQMPGYYSPGDDSEAITYIVEGRRAWLQTDGALMWLRDSIDKK
jgi:tetratricopeptide (TPR) repeat protein